MSQKWNKGNFISFALACVTAGLIDYFIIGPILGIPEHISYSVIISSILAFLILFFTDFLDPIAKVLGVDD